MIWQLQLLLVREVGSGPRWVMRGATGLPVRTANHRDGRDEHQPACEPVAGVYREVADGPSLMVEIELVDRSDLTICRSNRKTMQILGIF